MPSKIHSNDIQYFAVNTGTDVKSSQKTILQLMGLEAAGSRFHGFQGRKLTAGGSAVYTVSHIILPSDNKNCELQCYTSNR